MPPANDAAPAGSPPAPEPPSVRRLRHCVPPAGGPSFAPKKKLNKSQIESLAGCSTVLGSAQKIFSLLKTQPTQHAMMHVQKVWYPGSQEYGTAVHHNNKKDVWLQQQVRRLRRRLLRRLRRQSQRLVRQVRCGPSSGARRGRYVRRLPQKVLSPRSQRAQQISSRLPKTS